MLAASATVMFQLPQICEGCNVSGMSRDLFYRFPMDGPMMSARKKSYVRLAMAGCVAPRKVGNLVRKTRSALSATLFELASGYVVDDNGPIALECHFASG